MRSLTAVAVLGCLLCTAGAAMAGGATNPAAFALLEPGSEPGRLTTPACAGAGRPALFQPEAIAADTSGCCTATCSNGSSVTCCGSSCSAVDASCAAYPQERGYCWSDSEGYKYCPLCPSCQNYNCGCENKPCSFPSSPCGTCNGMQCACVGEKGDRHCACP